MYFTTQKRANAKTSNQKPFLNEEKNDEKKFNINLKLQTVKNK